MPKAISELLLDDLVEDCTLCSDDRFDTLCVEVRNDIIDTKPANQRIQFSCNYFSKRYKLHKNSNINLTNLTKLKAQIHYKFTKQNKFKTASGWMEMGMGRSKE